MAKPLNIPDSTYICIDIDSKLISSFPGSVMEQKYVTPFMQDHSMAVQILLPGVDWQKNILDYLKSIHAFYLEKEYGHEFDICNCLNSIWKLLIHNRHRNHSGNFPMAATGNQRLKEIFTLQVVENTAAQVFIPFTVGGGIRSVEDIRKMLKAGADKVSLNTAAVKNPQVIAEGAKRFGRQCIVLAVDARQSGEQKWEVYINGGRTPTGIDVLEWVKKCTALGAGEILLTSMDKDGTKDGYDIPLTRAVSENVDVPVIASGGAGKLEDFYEVLTAGKADAVLAASVFHYGQFTVREVKEYLKLHSVEVRL
jgi:cyclase